MFPSLSPRSFLLKFLVLIVSTAFMTGIELCYFLADSSPFKWAAGLAWIVIAVSVFTTAVVFAIAPLIKSSIWKEPGMGWYVAVLVLPFFLIYFDINGIDWTSVNGEGVKEVTIGMHLLQHDPAFGMFSADYYNRYMARQYVLTALPSIAFGPGLVTLRLGNSFIYLVSYAAFLATLYWYLKARKINALLWASWTGAMFALAQYPLIQARAFEQTTMPLGATLMFMASLLYFLTQPSPLRVIWIAWSMSFFTCGYTPAYGSWTLAVVVLGYLAFAPGFRHKLLLIPIAQSAVSLGIAFLILQHSGAIDDVLTKIGDPSMTFLDWLWRYFSGFSAEFNAGFSVIPAPLGVVSFAVLFLSLKQRDYRIWAIFLWCCGIVLVSLSLDGSNFNVPRYDVHRSLIILPVIALGALFFYLRYYREHALNGFVETLAACSILYMVYTSMSFPILERHYLSDDNAICDMDESFLRISEMAHAGRSISKLYFDLAMKLSDDDLNTELAYFYPDAVVAHGPALPGPGSYFMHYNATPRDYDCRWPSHDPRPYITLEESARAK